MIVSRTLVVQENAHPPGTVRRMIEIRIGTVVVEIGMENAKRTVRGTANQTEPGTANVIGTESGIETGTAEMRKIETGIAGRNETQIAANLVLLALRMTVLCLLGLTLVIETLKETMGLVREGEQQTTTLKEVLNVARAKTVIVKIVAAGLLTRIMTGIEKKDEEKSVRAQGKNLVYNPLPLKRSETNACHWTFPHLLPRLNSPQ